MNGALLGADPADVITAEVGPSSVLAAIVASIPSWHADALCRDYDVELWFPARGASNRAAVAVCGRCPVRASCLDEALEDPTLDHGIRGGLTATARKVARRSGLVESEAS